MNYTEELCSTYKVLMDVQIIFQKILYFSKLLLMSQRTFQYLEVFNLLEHFTCSVHIRYWCFMHGIDYNSSCRFPTSPNPTLDLEFIFFSEHLTSYAVYKCYFF
jgi:hypothetical protein